MIPQELLDEIAAFQKGGYQIRYVVEGERVIIIFKNYSLPDGVYNMPETGLLVWTTIHYPSAGFDMFWTNKDLLLSNSQVPQNAQHIEPFLGENWRRFSIHPYREKGGWDPNRDSFTSYFTYIVQRLKAGV